MSALGPAHTAIIPSIHDGIMLDCQIYYPEGTWQKGKPFTKAAMIAHPYTALGGSQDDRIVVLVRNRLLKLGYIVGTFDFRGAGESAGKCSWSAEPELSDFVTFYGFMLRFLGDLQQDSMKSQSDEEGTSIIVSEEGKSGQRIPCYHPICNATQLILAGYSYGAMIASNLPPLDTVLDIFRSPTFGSVVRDVCELASSSAKRIREITTRTTTGPEKVLSRTGLTDPGAVTVEIGYLLVSPLVQPVRSFTSCSNPSFAPKTKVNQDAVKAAKLLRKHGPDMYNHPICVVYGDKDGFDLFGALRKWTQALVDKAHHTPMICPIEGAGHFFLEEGSIAELYGHVTKWVDSFEKGIEIENEKDDGAKKRTLYGVQRTSPGRLNRW